VNEATIPTGDDPASTAARFARERDATAGRSRMQLRRAWRRRAGRSRSLFTDAARAPRGARAMFLLALFRSPILAILAILADRGLTRLTRFALLFALFFAALLFAFVRVRATR